MAYQFPMGFRLFRFAVRPLRCFHLHVYEHDHCCVAEPGAAKSHSGTMVGDSASEERRRGRARSGLTKLSSFWCRFDESGHDIETAQEFPAGHSPVLPVLPVLPCEAFGAFCQSSASERNGHCLPEPKQVQSWT